MVEITATMVKELREKSGAGMMDCKKALAENSGDMEAAVDWLRTKGLAAAQKKAGRVAADGLVGMAMSADGKTGAVVEVNAETDFVARNETFQAFVGSCAQLSLKANSDLATLSCMAYPDSDVTVQDKLTNLVATVGENLRLRRTASLSVSNGMVTGYVHSAAAPGMGKIAVLVALESESDAGKLAELGKQVAMHVAATKPEAVSVAGLDPELIERERSVLIEQARESGKPENITEKMVEGRIRKYYQEVVLTEQVFVIDGETQVGKVVEQAAGDVGAPVSIAGFVRFGLGEGIEKKEEDFAAEVAAAVSGS
ncbi:MAG: elongation factor Ts [Rhodospirillales bacterium]|nr:elongation factor Ts [Rhodospirillales bacterium]